MRFLLTAASVLMLATGALAADAPKAAADAPKPAASAPQPAAAAPQPEEGFVSLFDGKTLDGWKVGANPSLFQVRDGMIVMDCPTTINSPAHLFYEGDVGRHDFKNFDLKVDVMTFPKANSGIYFHTRFQESGFPKFGIECQVDNSHSDWQRTGTLYNLKIISWGPEAPPKNTKQDVTILPKPPVTDNVWYTQEIIYQNGAVTVKLDGKTMIEYKIADADTEHRMASGFTWSPRGTFALQGHPPMKGQISKVYFKNIRVKVLPD